MKRIGLVAFATLFLFPIGLSAKPAAWNEKMRALESVLNRLLIDISSDERFGDKKNFKAIEKNANQLASLAHSIRSKADAPPDKDLSVQLIGSDFATEAAQAAKTLAAGHRAYARVMLGSMTNYCIACHTRSGNGPQFQASKVNPELEKLTPLARGKYFIATRNFDQALGEFSKISTDEEKAALQPFEYERAIRAGLSVAIRVKRDPDLALKLVESALKNAKAPYYFKEKAGEWKKSLLAWKAEKPFSSSDPEKLFDEANRLVALAKSAQKYPADRSADMIYLRASGVLHELLALSPKGAMAANALYLAGLTYEVLDDYGVKDFGEFYFRACIQNSPHTEISRACYRHYEESVYFGYTGSGGTFVPYDVRARLNGLELLSMPPPELKPESPKLQ